MKVAVRYYSRNGHCKKIADIIAEVLSVEAINIEIENRLKENVDILFLGGSPYLGQMDGRLRDYAYNLKGVKKVVLFSVSTFSKRAILKLKEIIENKGIEVDNNYLLIKKSEKDYEEKTRDFARIFLKN